MQEFASAGIYYFRTGNTLKDYFEKAVQEDLQLGGEYYASLPYNLMIRDGLEVRVFEMEQFLQWGTPEDLQEYQAWSDWFQNWEDWRPSLTLPGTTLIPAAGSGQRFVAAGYSTPKPLIPMAGVPMLSRAVATLPRTPRTAVVVREELFNNAALRRLGMKLVPTASTQGQAETCLVPAPAIDTNESLLIAACDAAFAYSEKRLSQLVSDPSIDLVVWTFRNHPHANRNPGQYGWAKADEAGNIESSDHHRDLKPDNIYLVKDDDREIAKVLDFGIAKAATQLDGGNTKTGAMLGTPYYMSPEQAQGIKAVDHRSDLWSLAIIVFQALTGRLPFESEALGDLLVKIIVAPVPMPSQFAPDLPAAIDRWWTKAANRDPAQRYQSAKELSDGLALVFGQSQLTDVMDRSELHAAMARQNAGGGGYPQANTPGYGPQGGVPSPSPYGNTPHPGQMGLHTPQPAYQGTAVMGATPQPAGQPQHVITGAPMARTFGEPPQPPKSKAGLFIGIGAAVVIVALVGVIGSMAMKSKKDATAATAVAPPATQTVPPAASSAPVVLAPPPTPSATASVAAVDPGTPAPAAPAPAAPARPRGRRRWRNAACGPRSACRPREAEEAQRRRPGDLARSRPL